MTKDERHVLHSLTLRPNGAVFRSEELKAAVLSLAKRNPPLVCDPHTLERGHLFTRITVEGKLAAATDAHFVQ